MLSSACAQAMLAVGYLPDELERLRSLLVDLDAEMIKVSRASPELHGIVSAARALAFSSVQVRWVLLKSGTLLRLAAELIAGFRSPGGQSGLSMAGQESTA